MIFLPGEIIREKGGGLDLFLRDWELMDYQKWDMHSGRGEQHEQRHGDRKARSGKRWTRLGG